MINIILEKLKKITDFRKDKGKRHELWVVLTIIILGIMMGNTSYKTIEKFSKNNKDKLINILKIPSKKLPSYSTIRRVMIGVKAKYIQKILDETILNFYKNNDEDWIAIDGKNAKNTLRNYENEQQNMLVTVSWFSQNKKLIIKSESFESKKKSEIKQVQNMIRDCSLKNKVFTLDALHCNKETTKAIIESKNDYLITVKGNQKKLYECLKNIGVCKKPLTIYEKKDLSHGRNIKRRISVFDGKNVKQKNYPHLKSFIKVERSGMRGKKSYEETLYYITSKKLKAEILGQKIREHWSIENQVHWVKDVIFNEDKLRIKGIEVTKNFTLLVTLILNVYRSLGFISITEGKSWLENNWSKILLIGDLNTT